MQHISSQLCLGGNEILDLGKLVVEVKAFRVRQSPAGLDFLARDDLLDRQLDLFEVDGCLVKEVKAVG